MRLSGRTMDVDERGTVGIEVEILVRNLPFQDITGDFRGSTLG